MAATTDNNAVRLQLHALAYNLAIFMRTLALPKGVVYWSLTTLRENLVKIGAKVVAHGRYVTFRLAKVAVARDLFREILRLIDGLRPSPTPAWAGDIDGTSKRQARYVCMTRKLTERPSKRGPISKIMLSDGCGRDAVSLAVGRWYDFPELGGYLGNVG